MSNRIRQETHFLHWVSSSGDKEDVGTAGAAIGKQCALTSIGFWSHMKIENMYHKLDNLKYIKMLACARYATNLCIWNYIPHVSVWSTSWDDFQKWLWEIKISRQPHHTNSASGVSPVPKGRQAVSTTASGLQGGEVDKGAIPPSLLGKEERETPPGERGLNTGRCLLGTSTAEHGVEAADWGRPGPREGKPPPASSWLLIASLQVPQSLLSELHFFLLLSLLQRNVQNSLRSVRRFWIWVTQICILFIVITAYLTIHSAWYFCRSTRVSISSTELSTAMELVGFLLCQ